MGRERKGRQGRKKKNEKSTGKEIKGERKRVTWKLRGDLVRVERRQVWRMKARWIGPGEVIREWEGR